MSTSREHGQAAAPAATTTQRVIVPDPPPAGAEKILPCELAKYEENGYARWSYAPGLAPERRLDLLPEDRDEAAAILVAGPLRFLTISDIHVTDVQAPAQAILFGYKGFLSSAYSGQTPAAGMHQPLGT